MLLKNILGLLPPERGEIWVEGDQIVGLREKRRYEVRKKFGVLSQDSALFGSMNLYDNIATAQKETGATSSSSPTTFSRSCGRRITGGAVPVELGRICQQAGHAGHR